MFNNSIEKPMFDFNDFTIVPQRISKINSRKDVVVDTCLMVSPMDSVVNEDNWYKFFQQNLVVCMPRCTDNSNAIGFQSLSLTEFMDYTRDIEFGYREEFCQFLLVDIANGHMSDLLKYAEKFKNCAKAKLMIGNIANPRTFEDYAKVGVDYIRVGIGGGSACLTSANTGVHYPMASLIAECYEIKKSLEADTKIVADGGFRNFDEIIKALALGADYVMLGSILNKCLESCAPMNLFGITIKDDFIQEVLWNIRSLRPYLYKSYRGMSTKEVQRKWNRSQIKTSEGISKFNKVEYTIKSWVENFNDYLRSAMSYTGSKNLAEFKECEKVFITQNALHRFKK